MTARWVGAAAVEFVTLPYRFFQRCDTASITGDGETIWGRGNQYPPQTTDIGFVWHGSSFEVSGVYVRNASSFDGSTAVGVQYRSPRYGGYTYAMLDGEPLPFPDFESNCEGSECLQPCAEPGDCEAAANGLSEDGRVIVGSARFVSGAGSRRAVPDGWRLTRVNSLSPDGHFLVGEGFNVAGEAEGWVAHLPEL